MCADMLEHALRHPLGEYTVKSHKNSNGITPNTARADLESLVTAGLLQRCKRGREVVYRATARLTDRLARTRARVR